MVIDTGILARLPVPGLLYFSGISGISVLCEAISIEKKSSYHLSRPEHFNRLGNFQSQGRQVKAFEIFF